MGDARGSSWPYPIDPSPHAAEQSAGDGACPERRGTAPGSRGYPCDKHGASCASPHETVNATRAPIDRRAERHSRRLVLLYEGTRAGLASLPKLVPGPTQTWTGRA